MRYRVRHTTTYRYEDAVSICQNELRLTPRSGPCQIARRTQLLIDPPPTGMSTHHDWFGNVVTFFTLEEPHREMVVTAVSDVDRHSPQLPEPASTMPWEAVRRRIRSGCDAATLTAREMLYESPHVTLGPDAADYAAASFPADRPLLDAVVDLTMRIHADFKYTPGATSIATSVGEVLALRRGVCQDFAHLEIACLRALGLAARYVSGYVRTLPAPGAPRAVGADASHAWVAVWEPTHGWVDVDPTNASLPATDHVTLAWGRDYGDVSPMTGVILGGGEHTVAVAVDVAPAMPASLDASSGSDTRSE